MRIFKGSAILAGGKTPWLWQPINPATKVALILVLDELFAAASIRQTVSPVKRSKVMEILDGDQG